MRRNRIIWAILWILSLIGISLFGGSISYGFFAVVTALPVISIVYLVCVNLCFKVYQEVDTNRLTAGRTVPFTFKLINEFFFDFAAVRVRFYSSFSSINGLDDQTTYELLPGTGIERQTELICRYRGEYEVGIKIIETWDFLGLFRFSFKKPEPLRVQVRPALIRLESLRMEEDPAAAVRDNLYSVSEPDVLVREYVPGDDIRQMNWKASARSGKLMIRRRIGEEQQGIGILMSAGRCSREPHQYLPAENKILEVTLALSFYFAGKNLPVELYYLQGDLMQDGLDVIGDFDAYYDRVSQIQFEEENTDELLYTQVIARNRLYRLKTVFLVIYEDTDRAAGVAEILKEQNIRTVIYRITRDGEPAEKAMQGTLSRTEIVCVPADSDLTEVM